MASVVIASTDADFFLLLSHILTEAKFAVSLARSVEEIVNLSSETNPVAILLDCRSADSLAKDACLRLKQDATTFGIVTVALIGPGAEHQYMDLMTAGVDESFVRPIVPRKLIAFLEHLAGRAKVSHALKEGGTGLVYADIEIDLHAHRVMRKGRPVHLGPIEYRLLRHLVENAGQVCSRDTLINAAWQQGRFVDRKTVNVHIGRLRQALSASGSDIIRTVRTAGYMLDEDLGESPQD